ncbi:MAG: DUF3108 domain-containing protein [Halioglobus sp.]
MLAISTKSALIAALLAAAITICQAAAENTEDVSVAAKKDSVIRPLTPYSAQYTTKTRGMSLTLNRQLKQDTQGNYTLTNGGKIIVFGFHEVSVFSVASDQIIPRSYVYQGTGLVNRRREVHFTPGAETIRSLYKKEWYELPYSPGTLDRMSQQEQLRLMLINDPTPKEDVVLRIADGKRIKDYQLAYLGEETLQTPMGPVDTLHFGRLHDDADRKSDTWIAPDWDYLMVRTVHIEDGKPVEVNLVAADINGRTLTPAE